MRADRQEGCCCLSQEEEDEKEEGERYWENQLKKDHSTVTLANLVLKEVATKEENEDLDLIRTIDRIALDDVQQVHSKAHFDFAEFLEVF